jgi:3-hydroxybutyryl-CoA dehydratase
MAIKLDQLRTGASLPEMQKMISQADINLYAQASRDFNPIHIDEEFARRTPAGGTIAHGMLILAYISEVMTRAFERNWLTAGGLNVRFKAPARPGDVIRVQVKVEKIVPEGESGLVICGVTCLNQTGDIVVNGEARVRLNTK